MSLVETKNDFKQDLKIDETTELSKIDEIIKGEGRYIRDLRINVKNALQAEGLLTKEAYLIALSVAVNEKNDVLIKSFTELAKDNEATDAEIAEIYSCASLLGVNNVFYRFRHFVGKESYQNMPARVKMNIMMNPVLGKEFFELVSLVISAVNGCEMCVKSHEVSVLNLGASEERIFDAIRLGAVIRGLSQLI